MTAGGDVFFEAGKSTLAAYRLVILAIPSRLTHILSARHAGKGQLGIGGNRGREEAYLTGQVEKVVDAEVAIAPQLTSPPSKSTKREPSP